MKKYTKEFIILILLCGLYYAFDNVASNFTSQQLDNFMFGATSQTSGTTPDSSYAVRLMPDHVILFKEDTIKGAHYDTIKTYSVIGGKFAKRFKFTITAELSTIYAKVSGPGTDSVRIRSGEYFSSDYLHPKFDSVIYLRDSNSSTTANYRIEFQGR